ncbi:hypothetical protein ALQ07_102801 [Pseudomonas syringae pv. actinidiae]|uniref:Uncharacterized protein n=1 Tax=Pseudomonas syringae pv. actinidiae TaxID=103796 RepID=A0A3M4K577_PSESF|nr:hypothetical protein ALQ07_102801 [Pseudomonas syringae pv. actinidiae]
MSGHAWRMILRAYFRLINLSPSFQILVRTSHLAPPPSSGKNTLSKTFLVCFADA